MKHLTSVSPSSIYHYWALQYRQLSYCNAELKLRQRIMQYLSTTTPSSPPSDLSNTVGLMNTCNEKESSTPASIIIYILE